MMTALDRFKTSNNEISREHSAIQKNCSINPAIKYQPSHINRLDVSLI